MGLMVDLSVIYFSDETKTLPSLRSEKNGNFSLPVPDNLSQVPLQPISIIKKQRVPISQTRSICRAG
jgi:hypothetical protein